MGRGDGPRCALPNPAPLGWISSRARHKLASRTMSPTDRLLQIARWRWTPLVIPTVGTSVFVLLLAWLVPEDLGHGAHTRRPAVAGLELHTPSDATNETDDLVPSVAPVSNHVSTQSTSHQPNRRRGFSPPLERPSEPPPPPPPPPPVETPPPPPPPVSEGPNSDRWREGQQAASNAATRAGARAGAFAARVHARNQAMAEPTQVEAPPTEAPPAEPAPSTTDVPDAAPAPQ
jgi:hypothetical protein